MIILPPQIRGRCRFLSPFLQSHAFSIEVLDAGPGCTMSICDKPRVSLAADPLHVRSELAKVATKTSPARRALLKTWYFNRDLAQSLNAADKICACERSPEIYDTTQCVRIGWIDGNANSWVWNRRAAATAGINLTQDVEANATENRDQGATYDEFDAMDPPPRRTSGRRRTGSPTTEFHQQNERWRPRSSGR